MNKIKQYFSSASLLWGICLCAVLLCTATSCKDDNKTTEAPYIRFNEEVEMLSYNINGGSLQIEMYTNMGPWVIEPEFREDAQWLDVWPKEGDQSGRFKITVSENTTAFTRFSNVSVVVNGKPVKTFKVRQAAGDAFLELDMGGNTMNSPSKGAELSIPLKTNLGWKAEVVGEAKSWIELVSAEDDKQLIKVIANAGAQRAGQIKFTAIGTNNDHLTAEVNIKQFDMSKDPYNGEKKTVEEILTALGSAPGVISQNQWIDVFVTSDLSKLNFSENQMFVQDANGRGILIEFASARDNTFAVNTNLKIHMYEAEFVRDPLTKGLKMVSFLASTAFETAPSATGATPVEIDNIVELDNYENTLVTLRDVEFAIPMGTYVNSDETQYGAVDGFPLAAEYHDGNKEYGHLLRDKYGNVTGLYSSCTFLDRFVSLMPQGAGALTGIVAKRTKNGVTSNCLRLRSHADNKVSNDKSQRVSQTKIQFGPFIGRDILPRIASLVGDGQLKTTMWENVSTTAGTSIDWGWSYARRTTATISIASDGTQSASPQLSSATNQDPVGRMFSCLSCQWFWNFTGSMMNREGMPADYKGEAWVIKVENFSATKDIALTFSYASSSTGPLTHIVEWSTNESNPVSLWNTIEDNFVAPIWNSSTHLKQYTMRLPDQLKSLSSFVIRLRVKENLRASNNGGTISPGGAPRIAYIDITERK